MVVRGRNVHAGLVPVIVLVAIALVEHLLNAIDGLEFTLTQKIVGLESRMDAGCRGFLGTVLVFHSLMIERRL